MKHGIANGIWAAAWALGGGSLLLTTLPASAAPAGKPQAAVSRSDGLVEVLRRLKELEAQVGTLKAEGARLQAELDTRGKAGPPPAAQPAEPGPQAAAPASEWDEPAVVKAPEGRDEEARRRLTEVQTQVRKMAAAAARQEEEASSKVKFDFSGKYKARYNVRNNFDLGNPRQTWGFDNDSFVDHRFQFQVDASYQQLMARLLLDKGNFVFDWKEDGEGTLERWGEFNTVNSALVRELFVEYTGDGVLRVGRQVWNVGNQLVHSGPADSIKVQYPLGRLPWGQSTLTAAYTAIAGGWKSYSTFRQSGPPAGDRQAVLGASNKLDAFYFDLEARPSRNVTVQPYVLKVNDRSKSGDADLNLDKDFDSDTTARDGHFKPLWTGATVAAEVDGWKFDAEGVLLTGSYSRSRDLSANALLLAAERKVGTYDGIGTVSAGLGFGRGSGGGTDSGSGTVRDFNGLFLCRDRHKFGNIFSEDVRAGYYFWDSNLSNVTYLRLHAVLEPIANLKVMPSVSKMWTTESVYRGRGPVGDWSRGSSTSAQTTNDVGWEVDLNISYPLRKNLDSFVSLGYFQPGAVYARPDGSTPAAAQEVVAGMEFKF